jgi:hypothetical protein
MALRRYARFTIPILTLGLWVSPVAATDHVQEQIAAQLPGWTIAQMAKGDLNQDSRTDVVVTLQQPGASDEGTPGMAMLAIFFGGPGGTLRLHTKAPQAVCVGCGGPRASFIEVLGSPSISAKGILNVTYEGGSREAWTVVFKWRYDVKTDHFILIGETRENRDTLSDGGEMPPGEVTSEDINYSSGRMIRTISKGGTQRCRVKPALRAITLADFDFESFAGEDRFVEDSCK